ncbi:MAG: hypothetical protein HQ589_01745 [Syntrophaceae bacterium]|nr:hypothetical protein [Syntrophaceae bacterium]
MYIIDPTDLITDVTPSTEDADFLAVNFQDNFRTNPWKATGSVESTLTLTVSTGSAAIGLSYMNSGTVNVLVVTAGPTTEHDELYTIDSDNPNLFVNYGAVGAATITLTFADPGTTIPYCGIVRCAAVHEFNNPKYGMTEGLKDYSIVKRRNSGALYYKSRDIVRTFSGQFNVTRDSDFYTFMHTIIKAHGQEPLFWKVADLSNHDWAIFAECSGMPSGSHSYFEQSNISFSLLEAM